MTQKILPPEKAPSTSVAHPSNLVILSILQRMIFFYIAILSLHYDPTGSYVQCSSGEGIHPQLPLDTQAVSEDMANLGLR